MSPNHRRRTAESIIFALLFSTFLLSAARADEPGFKSIFNGKDLTGWRLGDAELAGKRASDDGRFAVKDGDWNAIEVIVTGSKARCTCNGELLEAALAIPDNGPLALQSEINVVEYRNIRIKRD